MKSAEGKLLLFDLDGTLTDPGIGITNSVMYALKEFGISVGQRADYYKYIGPPLVESFMHFEGATHSQALELLRLYRVYFADKGIYENSVYPGIPQLLKSLKGEGAVLSLATSKPELFSLKILEHFGLSAFFDYAACSTMDEKRTDKREVIAFALELAGRKAGDEGTIMIGDRKHDIIGAAGNGLKSIGVLYGYGNRAELEEAGADYIADSVRSLENILDGM